MLNFFLVNLYFENIRRYNDETETYKLPIHYLVIRYLNLCCEGKVKLSEIFSLFQGQERMKKALEILETN